MAATSYVSGGIQWEAATRLVWEATRHVEGGGGDRDVNVEGGGGDRDFNVEGGGGDRDFDWWSCGGDCGAMAGEET